MKHSISRQVVPRETFLAARELLVRNEKAISLYIDQLLWWNRRINLVSRDVSRGTIKKHILHSLLLSQFEVYEKAELIVDTGTGGGIPGVPLAITHPGKRFVLNDIVSKKTLAVKQIIKKIELNNVTLINSSVAKLVIEAPFLLVSKHAFKINTLYHLTNKMPWTRMVFFKGGDFLNELAEIKEPLSVVDWDLSEENDHSFYTDKSIIIVSRL